MNRNRLHPLVTVSCLVLALSSANSALAFKIDTHVWLAAHLWQEIDQSNGALQIRGLPGRYQMDAPVVAAIRAHRGAFLMGVLGADAYPDLVAGQMTTHPGVNATYTVNGQLRMAWQTDDWLRHVRDSAIASGDPEALAFAYGYLLHAAMDTWAHTYVNLYVGEVFLIFKNQEAAERHVALESFIKAQHRTLLTDPDLGAASASSSVSSREAATEIGRIASNPGRVLNRETDAYSALHVPARFVLKTLVLNPVVAEQYRQDPIASYVHGMYEYWAKVRDLPQAAAPLRGAFNAAYSNFVGLVANADGVFKAADSAYRAGLDTARRAADAVAIAERQAADAATGFAQTALGFLPAAARAWDQLTVIQAARNLITSAPPAARATLGPLVNAATTLDQAESALASARTAHDEAVVTLQGLQTAAESAAEDFNIKNATLGLLNSGRGIANQITDAALDQWRLNVEAALEAYIVAFEDTAKELMRPHGGRFSAGNDPAGPLKRWAMCWGPALGLAAHPAAQSACSNLLFDQGQLMERISLLPKQAILPQGVRNAIETAEQRFRDAGLVAFAQLGNQLAPVLQITEDQNLAGFGAWAARLWDTQTGPADLDLAYASDASGKGLVTYDDMHATVLSDMGFNPAQPPAPGSLSLQDLGGFAPVQNALTMSKLALLGGSGLNKVARSWTVQTVDKSAPTTAAGASQPPAGSAQTVPVAQLVPDLYPQKALAGAALIGALRSIDGDHQWLPTAPGLPRRNGMPASSGCPRFGYPGPGAAYPARPPQCGADPLPPAILTSKGGFRFWQDATAREQVFNRMFLGPVTPGLCAATGQSTLPAFGIACAGGVAFIDPDAVAPTPAPTMQRLPARTTTSNPSGIRTTTSTRTSSKTTDTTSKSSTSSTRTGTSSSKTSTTQSARDLGTSTRR
ncbi:MAG: hypothetical protein R3E86_00795 [Pseudomonadales bacterium]